MTSKAKNKLSFSALYTVSQVLIVTILTAVLFGYVIRTEGIEVLGIWSLLLSFGSVSRLMEMGLTGAITRFVATYNSQSTKATVAKVISTALVAVLIVMLVLMPIIYSLISIFVHLIPIEISESLLLSLIGYSLLGLSLVSLASILLSGLDGLELFGERTLIVISGQFIMTIVAILLLPAYGIFALVLGMISQSVLTILLSIWRLCSSLNVNLLFVTKFDFIIFKEIFSYGSTLLGTSVLMIFFEPVSKLLLLWFGGLSFVGFFELANQIVQKIRSLFVAANQVLIPRFATASLNKNNDDKDLYRKVLELLFPIVLCTFSFIYVGRDFFALVLIGDANETFNLILGICCLTWGFNTLTLPVYFYNIGVGKAYINFICFLMISIINITMGLILGGMFGLNGVLFSYAFSLAFGTSYLLLKMKVEKNESEHSIFSFSNSLLLFSLLVLIWTSSRISFFKYDWNLADFGLISFSALFVIYVLFQNPIIKRNINFLKKLELK